MKTKLTDSPILCFRKDIPKKMSTKEWLSISADGAPPGVYTPNMSKQDMLKWKAKLIKGSDPRIEIRKTFEWHNNKKYPKSKNYTAQVLFVVRLDSMDEPNVLFSTNGKIPMNFIDLSELWLAIAEAKMLLTQMMKNKQ